MSYISSLKFDTATTFRKSLQRIFFVILLNMEITVYRCNDFSYAPKLLKEHNKERDQNNIKKITKN